jgi:hypothetical protein
MEKVRDGKDNENNQPSYKVSGGIMGEAGGTGGGDGGDGGDDSFLQKRLKMNNFNKTSNIHT